MLGTLLNCVAVSVAEQTEATTNVSVVEDLTVDPIVVVNYPWKVHSRPSIEVQLITDPKTDATKLRPPYFVKRHLQGRVTVDLYRCHDGSAELPTGLSFTKDEIDFDIFGRRNSLGRPSVCVGYRYLKRGLNSIEARRAKPVVGSIFCLLDSWAIDKRELHLDLPKESFSQSGRIRVWFMREGAVVWSQTVDWPGYKVASKD